MALRLKLNAPVILGFSLVATVIYFLDQASGGSLLPYFTSYSGVSLSHPITIFQLFSHVLGHVNLEHLLGNLTFILLLGPIIEEKYGSSKTLFMILVTALITGLLNVLLLNTGLLGASGIVFMLILLVSFTNVRSGEIPISFILVAILFIGKEILAGLQQDSISQFAHIIGGICGGVFGYLSYSSR